jgi:hypothetical protein
VTGAERIAAERQRQIDAEGYDAAHDDAHDNGDIAEAALAYLTCSAAYWPWEPSLFKREGRVRDLEKSGALIAAEIDRLLRARA